MENKFITQTVTCKSCGKVHQVNCYPIINFQGASKEFLESVFSLELFKVKCECGAETIVQYDTVIIDMYKKYIIYLFLNGTDEEFYKEVQPVLTKMLSENEEYKTAFNTLKHTRLVKSINALLEKLLIFDYDLDDRVIELMKYSLLKNEKFQKDNLAQIFFDKLDGTNLIFTAISANQNTPPRSIGLDIAYYNKILTDTKINEFQDIPFARIDQAYVNMIIEKPTETTETSGEVEKQVETVESENKTEEVQSEKTETEKADS